jgi:hypothetical protein
MTEFSIIREADDVLAEVRISIGKPPGFDGIYIVFRGEPKKVIEVLEKALIEARVMLPDHIYQDDRGKL